MLDVTLKETSRNAKFSINGPVRFNFYYSKPTSSTNSSTMDSSSVINFYETRGPYGSFSNFSRHSVWMKERKWPTSEHYFQAMKFEGTPHETEVLKAPNPSDAAKLGRDRSKPLRKDWEQVKDEIMRQVCFAKFTQHKDIKEVLLGTGDATLVEHTANDRYWGDGGDGTGKNMLGKTLMIVRQQIRDLEAQKTEKPQVAKQEEKQVPNSMAASDEEVDDDEEEEDSEDEEIEEEEAPKERYVNGLRIISAPSANANPKRALGKKQKNRRKRNVFVDEAGTSKMEKSNELHGNIKLVGEDTNVTFSEKALPPSAKMVVHKHQFQRRWEPNERDLKRSEDDDDEDVEQTQRKPVSFADYLQTQNTTKSDEGMTADQALQAAESALEVIKVMPEDAELKERCKLICGVMKEWIERTEDETLLGKLIAKLDELSVYDQ